ncbi:MAG: hypothetical protein ACKOCO_11825, partial [Bacteroidota bacterium]
AEEDTLRDSAVTSAVRYSAVFSLRNSAVKQNHFNIRTLDQNRTLTDTRNVSGPPAPEKRHINRKTPPPNIESPRGVKLAKLRLLACFLSFF